MSVKLTTFSEAQNDISQFEQQQAAAQPAQEGTSQSAASEAAGVAPEASQAAPITQEAAQQQAAEENNSSSFKLSLDEEGSSNNNAAPAQVSAAEPTFNWKDEIKKIDKKELLKEVGFNDFAIEINEHLTRGGSAADYLNAKAIDYNKVSDESLIKSDLKTQYPTLTPSQIDLLFNRRYIVSEDASDEDREFVQLQQQTDAYKIRQTKITEQQSFKIPDATIPQTDEAYEQWKEYKESQSQLVESVNSFYANHEATKKLNESKRVTISLGEGVAPFNFNIDKPELITKTFTDGGELWQKMTSTKTGEPDVPKQQLISLFSFNPQGFIQDIFNYGMQMGVRNKIVAEGQNAMRPPAKVIPVDQNSAPTYGTGKYGDKAR